MSVTTKTRHVPSAVQATRNRQELDDSLGGQLIAHGECATFHEHQVGFGTRDQVVDLLWCRFGLGGGRRSWSKVSLR